ncbi:MAG: hypothetical protein AAF401_09810 [Pseudomonadota bacterium]
MTDKKPDGADAMMEMYLDMVKRFTENAPIPDGLTEGSFGKEQAFLKAMTQAQMIWMQRGATTIKEMSEVAMRRWMEASEGFKGDLKDDDTREHARMIALDKMRSCLRELGEIGITNAEAFQDEMFGLEAALRESQAPEPNEAPRRYAKAKK